MFSQLRGWEWLIIVALVLLLFGAKRLPDAARGLGRSLRIFKAETKGLAEDGKGAAQKPAGELAAQADETPATAKKSTKSTKDVAEG
jgi:sec-independent protein translocase protein TatA